MRCEDCLPLVEEYFDGEADAATAARMDAHLSACADCAAALDALSFEQEIYARYERGGLEVTPALWARVSAEIAREPQPATPAAAPRPFLSSVRGRFAAALLALGARPALASSLALLLLGVTAGSLWLAQRRQPAAPAEVASSVPAADAPSRIPTPRNDDGGAPPAEGTSKAGPAGAVPAMAESFRDAPREVAATGRRAAAAPVAAEDDSVERLLAAPASASPQTNANIVVIRAEDHTVADAAEALFANAPAAERDTFAGAARLPDLGEKDVARHVERAQMLLRSFKNARAAEEGSALDVAYERELSRRLLAENSTLKLEADVKGDKETRQVLDQIEPFLLDIANLREQPSREEVRSIKERVRKNEIVAALQVY